MHLLLGQIFQKARGTTNDLVVNVDGEEVNHGEPEWPSHNIRLIPIRTQARARDGN